MMFQQIINSDDNLINLFTRTSFGQPCKVVPKKLQASKSSRGKPPNEASCSRARIIFHVKNNRIGGASHLTKSGTLGLHLASRGKPPNEASR